jgi:membrane protein implicated in regulation of membrane protease activity
VFLLAWIFLAAAVASLYAGLSAEGLGFFYLAMAASGLTVILVVVQVRRGTSERSRRRSQGPPGPAGP